ncbi:CAF1-domain-containing protein [Aureobasidium sp. EXF-3400]|nr:CAF1-domain-containing protein [Aureobasidium sp. EXF-12344]KAI4770139.1 CAF1-domain-containing protein [Aureobasidium sp. EXF-3400]
MDIDKHSFPSRLLDVLEAIAEAHFVSFDLELSGVPVKGQAKEKPGKPSLQERYLETKKAAEQYQILQIGLTCVKDDVLQSAYVCKPFNFNLSPVIEERLDVDRTFSFHSGAAEFLLGVGFKFDLPFTSGVPYLSRDEAQLAEERAAARNDKSSFTDIEIKPEDVQALEFLKRVRSEVDGWLKTGQPSAHSVVIGPVDTNQDSNPELNRFERRLVHQIIRAEYPNLVTIPNKGLVRVSRLDPEREEYIKVQRKREVQDRIIRQTGFRWIVEALCGNAPDSIDVRSFAQTPGGVPGFVDLDMLKSRFNRAKHMIRNKKTALFGHNLFLDLIYFYRTFIGALPDTVEEFSNLIHELFPIIVDTKYMATHNCGDINPQSSLEQLAEKLAEQQNPSVTTHEHYNKYTDTTAFHEAGYDSMLTAEVAVRLSAKLELAGSHGNDEPQNTIPPTPPDVDGGGVQLDNNTPSVINSAIDSVKGLIQAPFSLLGRQTNTPDQQTIKPTTEPSKQSTPEDSLAEQTAELEITENESAGTTSQKSKKKKKKNKKKKNTTTAAPSTHSGGRFAHATAFDHLQDTLDEASEEEEAASTTPEEVLEFDALPSEDAHASDPVVADTDGVSDPQGGAAWDTIPVLKEQDVVWGEREVGTVMPSFESGFWKVYGNKLRVFGEKEEWSGFVTSTGFSLTLRSETFGSNAQQYLALFQACRGEAELNVYQGLD